MAPRAQSARQVRSTASLALLLGAVSLNACDGDVVNLGSSERSLRGGDAGAATAGSSATAPGGAGTWRVEPEPVLADSTASIANGTLDAEMTELFYTEQAHALDAPTSIYRATSQNDGFGNGVTLTLGTLAPGAVDEVNPALSADGKVLWLGMLGESGNTDIYVSNGEGDAWSQPELVAELSSPLGDDVPRPPAVGGTIMPLSSKRHGSKLNLYQLYLSERADPSSPWGEPSQDLVASLNSPSFQSADGFLNDRGLELYFSSTRDGKADLYVATRAAVTDPFGEPQLLVDLHSDAEERMPWLSPDEHKLYFTSNRSGAYALYVATRP